MLLQDHDCFLRRMCSFYHHLFTTAVVLSTTSSSATFATRGMSSPSSCELLRTPGVRGSLPDTAQYGCAWLTSGDKSITLLFVFSGPIFFFANCSYLHNVTCSAVLMAKTQHSLTECPNCSAAPHTVWQASCG